MPSQTLFLDADEGRSLHVLGDRVRVLADAACTGGRYEVFEVSGTEGSGPAPHGHPWDEVFFLLEGEIDVTIGDRCRRCGPGSFALAPARVRHAFRVVSPRARFLALTAAAGAGALFDALDRAIGTAPAAPDAIRALATRHGVSPGTMPAQEAAVAPTGSVPAMA